jgi:hypothetical protein
VAMALAVIATSSSCSIMSESDDETTAESPNVEFSPSVDAPGDSRPVEVVALPLTALLVRSEELDRARFLALEQAKAACMEDLGFHYPRASYVPVPEEVVVDRPFGPWTAREIEAFGYDGPTQDHPDPVEDYLATLSPEDVEAWDEAMNGGSTRSTDHIEVELVDGTDVNVGLREETQAGCNYQASSEVVGDLAVYEAYRQTLQDWNAEAFDRTEASDLVQQALSAWEGCMEAAGYGEFDEPYAPVDRFSAEPGVTEEERSAGLADVACKESSNLHGAWFVTKQQEEQEIVDQHPEVVTEWQRILDETRLRVQ